MNNHNTSSSTRAPTLQMRPSPLIFCGMCLRPKPYPCEETPWYNCLYLGGPNGGRQWCNPCYCKDYAEKKTAMANQQASSSVPSTTGAGGNRIEIPAVPADFNHLLGEYYQEPLPDRTAGPTQSIGPRITQTTSGTTFGPPLWVVPLAAQVVCDGCGERRPHPVTNGGWYNTVYKEKPNSGSWCHKCGVNDYQRKKKEIPKFEEAKRMKLARSDVILLNPDDKNPASYYVSLLSRLPNLQSKAEDPYEHAFLTVSQIEKIIDEGNLYPIATLRRQKLRRVEACNTTENQTSTNGNESTQTGDDVDPSDVSKQATASSQAPISLETDEFCVDAVDTVDESRQAPEPRDWRVMEFGGDGSDERVFEPRPPVPEASLETVMNGSPGLGKLPERSEQQEPSPMVPMLSIETVMGERLRQPQQQNKVNDDMADPRRNCDY